jgi:L-2-hydroxyglutarate oxidase LhgO
VSSRNSEVIHAGIYYATGLAKTRLCVEGKVMLYRFCREYGVQHRRIGKLIVAAAKSGIAKLVALEAQAKANGVDDLLWLSGAGVRALEPALRANRALLSPSTGIVDSHALMLALRPIFSSRRNASTAYAGSSIVRDRVPRPDGEPRHCRRDREPAPPAMTSPATTVAACPSRSRARKS